ncbi:35754_t:CDS:2, partial [Gigaspora margarita]
IEKKLQGPYVIKIYKKKSSTWQTVTGLVLSQRTKNKTLPDYIKENDIICFTCYNAIVVNASSEFQKHALDSHSHIEAEISNQSTFLSFLQAVKLITNVLYKREHNSDDSTSEDDDDDTKESADGISAP